MEELDSNLVGIIGPVSLDNTPVPANSPLLILRQNSLTVEQIYKNGISKKVHVVVKNHPFLIQVGLSTTQWEGQRIDFNRCPLEARLVYDNDCFKEVGFVKLKPIEFKAHVNERGDQATLELRPKVLTSQLEDMLFKVKIVALDNVTKQPVNGLCVLSESIKVVSKPEQVKKKKEPTKKIKAPKEEKTTTAKRPVEQVIGDGLSRIENNVLNHDRLLSMLALLENTLNEQHAQMVIPQYVTVKVEKKEEKKVEPIILRELSPFEQAFRNFLDAYDNLDPFEQPEKVRKVIKNSSPRDVQAVTEMIEGFSDPTPQQPTVDANCNNNNNDSQKAEKGLGKGCECNNCQYKDELSRIDEFYNRFLVAPDGIL